MRRVLVLGGTGEGRELAAALVARRIPVVSSLAGRVSSPRLPAGEVRVGGFGGAAGLAEYLRAERISAVVDATHPFAARIASNAVAACAAGSGTGAGAQPDTGADPAAGSGPAPTSPSVPLLILRRPPWLPRPGDSWIRVPDIASAADFLAHTPENTRILLTTGRQETAAFAPLSQHFWLRAVEPPDGPLPKHCTIILDRGPFSLESEQRLFRENNIHKIVTKNSGGPMTAAKLTAARELGLEVVVIERPPLPAGVPVVEDVDAAVDWVKIHR